MFKLEYDILVEESPKVVWAFLANLPVSMTCHRLRRCFQWIEASKPEEGARFGLELNLLGVMFRREGRGLAECESVVRNAQQRCIACRKRLLSQSVYRDLRWIGTPAR